MYLRKSIQINLKNILRDPTSILALLAAIIMHFMNGVDGIHTLISEPYLQETYQALDFALNNMINIVSIPLNNLFPFIGIVIAVDIFRDKRTQMCDISIPTQMSFRTYYLAKIITYYIISVVFCFGLTFIYETLYVIRNVPSNANFNFLLVLGAQAFAMIVQYTSCLLIPIAWAVFLSTLTGIPAVGALACCIQTYVPRMLGMPRFSTYELWLHVTPFKLWGWLAYWVNYRSQWYEVTIHFDFFDATFSYAVLCYLLQIAIFTTLFTASYFLLKRRFQKS